MKANPNLYLLQDGTYADPSDCSKGKDGVLRHKNGMLVCMTADGEPQMAGVDAVRNKNVEAAEAGKEAVSEVEAVKAHEPAVEKPAETKAH